MKARSKFVVFVDGSYPGDKVIAQIRKVRSSYAEAKSKRANNKITAPC